MNVINFIAFLVPLWVFPGMDEEAFDYSELRTQICFLSHIFFLSQFRMMQLVRLDVIKYSTLLHRLWRLWEIIDLHNDLITQVPNFQMIIYHIFKWKNRFNCWVTYYTNKFHLNFNVNCDTYVILCRWEQLQELYQWRHLSTTASSCLPLLSVRFIYCRWIRTLQWYSIMQYYCT